MKILAFEIWKVRAELNVLGHIFVDAYCLGRFPHHVHVFKPYKQRDVGYFIS